MQNGHAPHPTESALRVQRFSDIPDAIDIPVGGGTTSEAVEVDLVNLQEDPTEICDLLQDEGVAKNYWVTIALAYAKQDRLELAEEVINKGLKALNRGKPEEKLALYNCLCWMHLLKVRDAPRAKLGMGTLSLFSLSMLTLNM
jgi:RNA polymerase-associated protein CTR9